MKIFKYINRSHQQSLKRIVSTLLTALLVSQGITLATVACFESNGIVHMETVCSFDFHTLDTNEGTSENDLCQECVDIPLWPEKQVIQKLTSKTTYLVNLIPSAITLSAPALTTGPSNIIRSNSSNLPTLPHAQIALDFIRLLI